MNQQEEKQHIVAFESSNDAPDPAELAWAFPDPAYPDSSYYVDVARSIAAGHGLSIDVIWIFAEVGNRIPADPVLPVPSNAHWLPLASLVQVPFIRVLGPTALASLLPGVLLGALAAPLTWCMARDAGVRRPVALGAALLARSEEHTSELQSH